MMNTASSARDYRNAQVPKPSEYLWHLEALLATRPPDAPPLPVVPYCRVSTRQQKQDGNLDREVDWLTGELARLPVVLVTEAYTDVVPAYPQADKPDRPQLRSAAASRVGHARRREDAGCHCQGT